MISANSYPDGLNLTALAVIERQVSDEIAQGAEPTSALLDGTALERHNRRIAARAAQGIVTHYGTTLGYAFTLLAEVDERLATARAARQADPDSTVTPADFRAPRYAGDTR